MKKYVIIDSNNLCCRMAFSQSSLRSKEGLPSGVHFGTINSLISLKKKFPDYIFFMVWDGKSKRRMNESIEAVKKGIVPSAYKENREKDPEKMPQELKDFYQQAPFLQRAINELGISQVRFQDFECDDLIASYVRLLKDDNEIVIITSDEDYIQLLEDNVKVYDGMKMKIITKNDWEIENGLKVSQFLDYSSLCGDAGDNIISVSGWGEKTAIKEIKKYGTWQKTIESYKLKYADSRKIFPDFKEPLLIKDRYDSEKIFEELKAKKSEKTGKSIYPDIKFEMNYIGILNAFDKDLLKVKGVKTEIMALLFEERIRLAYSLKKMDDDIPDLPEIVQGKFNKERIEEYFEYYDITTLSDSINVFE